MMLASSFFCISFYEKVDFFILFCANFHSMWCRLPASCVSSRFAQNGPMYPPSRTPKKSQQKLFFVGIFSSLQPLPWNPKLPRHVHTFHLGHFIWVGRGISERSCIPTTPVRRCWYMALASMIWLQYSNIRLGILTTPDRRCQYTVLVSGEFLLCFVPGLHLD